MGSGSPTSVKEVVAVVDSAPFSLASINYSGLSQTQVDNLFSMHSIPEGKTTEGPRV